jgi:hypothetical protein
MLPESWLLNKYNVLKNTRAAIASHYGTQRRRRPQPAARNASQRIAYNNQIKSNDKPVSTLHAIAHAKHHVRVTVTTRQPTGT